MKNNKPLVIIPERIALRVVEEASAYLDHQLPRHWIRQLTHRAYVTLESNAGFRRKIERGNTGRDLLWSFMRHWLCAIIAKDLPHLHKQLPSDYNVGRQLPPPPPTRFDFPPTPNQRSNCNPIVNHPDSSLRIHGLLPEPV